MRILVCGGRTYDNEARLFEILDALKARYGEVTIIHGGCRRRRVHEDGAQDWIGADYLAGQWAAANRVSQMVFPADWSKGKSGGPRRNAEMLAKAEPQLVVAFPSPPPAENRGTSNMSELAQAAGVRVVWVEPS